MNERILTICEGLQKRIARENKGKTRGQRRIFSKKLKRDIIHFVRDEQMNFYEAGNIIGLSVSSLKNWDKQFPVTTFKKLKLKEVSVRETQYPSQKAKRSFDFLQILQLSLLALLLFERAVAHLIF